jgi:hypothetical protein
LSSFVFQEKTDNEPKLTPALEQGRDGILAIAERVGRVQDRWQVAEFSSGGGKNSGKETAGLHFGLCEVVWEWAKGTSFQEITKLTDVAEGTIVRVITRLDETCREVRDAARVIGDAGLFKKMEDAQARIKRDSECLIIIPNGLWEWYPDEILCSCLCCEFVFLGILSPSFEKTTLLDSLRPAYFVLQGRHYKEYSKSINHHKGYGADETRFL